MRFRAGHSGGAQWRAVVDGLIAQLGPARFNQDDAQSALGMIYFTDHLADDAQTMLDALRAATGVRHWTGSVGVGITGIDTVGHAREYLDEPGAAVMIADWPRGEFSVFSGKARAPAAGALSPSGAVAGHFAIVHGDPATPDMPGLIEDMAAKLASGFLVGGLSSSRQDSTQVADEILNGGLSGVVLSSAIGLRTRLTQGCAPLTPRYRVTRGERNVIAKLDDRPALDVFLENAGPELARDLQRAAHHILVGLPVAGSDTGDYLVRNVVGIDPRTRVIAIGAEVEQGMTIHFCRRDGPAARGDLELMLAGMRAELGETARGGVYFSCLGRGEHMFGERSAEAGIIAQYFPGVPIVGFAANGEISHDRLYGYTGVLTLFT